MRLMMHENTFFPSLYPQNARYVTEIVIIITSILLAINCASEWKILKMTLIQDKKNPLLLWTDLKEIVTCNDLWPVLLLIFQQT